MYSVCRCSLLVWRRSFLKKGTPRDLFLPRPGSAPGWIWPKNNKTCRGPWVLQPYQLSSKSIKRFWRRSRKCEKLTDGRRRTDNGRCAMTIAHLSLRLRWAKKENQNDSIQINACVDSVVGNTSVCCCEYLVWRRILSKEKPFPYLLFTPPGSTPWNILPKPLPEWQHSK